MQQAVKTISREEYLALEEKSGIKHEFYQGEIFVMSGGTFNHASICGNIYSALKTKLRGKQCTPMNSDMRIRVPSGLDTYPDVSVFCGLPELTDERRTLLNPAMIIEVLSPTTRDYDKGNKFTLYRSLPTLQNYILVESERVCVEYFRRADNDEWILREYTALTETLPLARTGETLTLAEIYEDIVFENPGLNLLNLQSHIENE
ncbi:MAG: Uma2 family endonuclease [Gammaproteobacteria bacterium]|nr:Uma2 family endonuclease [Gammaproteobacteria bacterium]